MKIVVSANDEEMNADMERVRKAQAAYHAHKYDGTLASWEVLGNLFWEMNAAEARLGRLFLSRIDATLIRVEEDDQPE